MATASGSNLHLCFVILISKKLGTTSDDPYKTSFYYFFRYYPGPGSKVFEMHYQLPKDLTCKQCVFQWRYVAGNNWGKS